jgi:hypothetical protein
MLSNFVCCLFFLQVKMTAKRATFKGHLMFRLSFKFDKTYMKMMASHSTIPRYGFFRLIDTIAAP